jgi:lipopolysaccharide/colanic/teichoic acid biosynthesis glycosyltransferase
MRVGADESPHQEYVRKLISAGEVTSSDDGQLYKLVIDDRVTSVGRVLRKTSFDEVPQLWNVLRGEMSLVGPRPVIPYEAELYPAWYGERFNVKPGLTGLWQVSGRNKCTYDEMIRLDVEFVRHRTVRLYLGILARTVPVVIGRRGAA